MVSYKTWAFLPATTWLSTMPMRWVSFFALILLLQGILGAVMWWLLRRRQRSTIQTEVLHLLVHEFQTPITAIRMSVDVLDSPIARNQPERTDKYVRIIREETERLQHQVETMLTLARSDRNTLILNTEPIQIYQLLRSVAERHGSYLQMHLSGTDPHLLADRLHLTNVLHNLLDNAIKYSADPPEITIHAETNARGLLIAVNDRGVGIAPTHLKQIFQPFFRVHDAKQPSIKGFGLGLSYVQRIVQAHNWRIDVTSKPGEGSEFRIWIPATALLPEKPTIASSNQTA